MDEVLAGLITLAVVAAPCCGAAVGLAFLGFWVVALGHVLTSDHPSKLPWVLAVIFAGPIGAALYWFLGRDQARPADTGGQLWYDELRGDRK